MKHFLATIFFIVTSAVLAQSATINGKITDNQNESLAGVNLSIKGTEKGTQTDLAYPESRIKLIVF